jgi:hypothetical protein
MIGMTDDVADDRRLELGGTPMSTTHLAVGQQFVVIAIHSRHAAQFTTAGPTRRPR